MTSVSHVDIHTVHRIGWLRAAVLGANDGMVSTASLLVGVAAAGSGRPEILVAGVAGLAAGAMSMAAGEYVSVSSQTDAERADTERERQELRDIPAKELEELTRIYVGHGLEPELAREVAVQLTKRDGLGAHLRDELGISGMGAAHPVQAAVVSALTFAAGAALPLAVALAAPEGMVAVAVALATLLALVGLGALGAHVGGAPRGRGALRVGFWGAMAMAVTAAVGLVFGVAA
ncbi:VIT1/CCC1 transporter family protein [Cereibacter sphaeroides]|uniref:VIT1/CCC1 transporter family protein n=1 Tax=Cereibacter sphaeroides TaxID=1063 RepID=UPI001F4683BC|nr:VIT1/CCC1 transporter family protein [Cereibacter sphaeroides]MCE6970514.1 VIT1/CCC1 transporter family protein [Cereibacter sphaeroides]